MIILFHDYYNYSNDNNNKVNNIHLLQLFKSSCTDLMESSYFQK